MAELKLPQLPDRHERDTRPTLCTEGQSRRLGPMVVRQVLVEIGEKATAAADIACRAMPDDLAGDIHDSIRNAIAARMPRLDTAFAERG